MSTVLVALPQFNVRLDWKHLQPICTKLTPVNPGPDTQHFSLFFFFFFISGFHECLCCHIGPILRVCVWALDQTWYCILQHYWHCVLLGMCVSALRRAPVFLIIVAINWLEPTLTYFLTSSSTDLGPWGNLHTGAGNYRKPSKGPEAVFGRGWKDALGLDLWSIPS